MTYHIRNLTSNKYFSLNDYRRWIDDINHSEEFETKKEAKDIKNRFIRENNHYYPRSTIIIINSDKE